MTQEVFEYCYKPPLNEFTGANLAFKDHFSGEYAVAANATLIAPPETKQGEVACFDVKKNEWRLVKDFRGVKYWDSENKEHLIEKLGAEPTQGARFTPPPKVFDVDAEKEKLASLFKSNAKSIYSSINGIFAQNIMLLTYSQQPDAENNSFLQNMAEIENLSVKDYVASILAKKASLEKAQKQTKEVLKEAKSAIAEITGEFSYTEVKDKYEYKFLQIQENIEALENLEE